MNEHSPTCPWHQDWHRCDCGAFDSAEHLAKEISQMSDKEVEDNVERFFGTKMSNLNVSGWLQCSQCGHGHSVERWEVECGDYTEGTACPECLIGLVKITWEQK